MTAPAPSPRRRAAATAQRARTVPSARLPPSHATPASSRLRTRRTAASCAPKAPPEVPRPDDVPAMRHRRRLLPRGLTPAGGGLELAWRASTTAEAVATTASRASTAPRWPSRRRANRNVQRRRNASVCTVCEAGKYQDATSQTECKDCPPGRYCPGGSPRAIECSAGDYQDATAQSACKACPAGSYCPTGAATPVPCRPGSYSDTEGAAECLVCPLGKAQPLTGRPSCSDCLPGSFAPTLGRLACVQCSPGKAQAASGAVAWTRASATRRRRWASLLACAPGVPATQRVDDVHPVPDRQGAVRCG